MMRLGHLTRRVVSNIHIRLDHRIILVDIPQHLILDRPFKEIQLPECGLNIGSPAHVRHVDSLPAAEWVEPFLRICAKLQLIIDIDLETFWGCSAAFKVIHSIMLLRVIRNKPVHDTERYIRGSVDDGKHFLHIFSAVFMVESEDFMKEKVILCVIDTGSVGESLGLGGWCVKRVFGGMLTSQHLILCMCVRVRVCVNEEVV